MIVINYLQMNKILALNNPSGVDVSLNKATKLTILIISFC